MNPRYAAYAAAHNLTADQMLEHDRARFPGGPMCGFMIWMGEQWRSWADAFGRSLDARTEADHAEFDAWLRGGRGGQLALAVAA